MVLLVSQRGLGLLLGCVLLVLIPWTFWSASVAAFRPERRVDRLIRMALWWGSVGVIVGVHDLQATQAQRVAREVSDKLVASMKAMGRCPASLEATGFSAEWLRDRLGKVYYTCREGKPILLYANAFNVFDKESFDFDSGQWTHLED